MSPIYQMTWHTSVNSKNMYCFKVNLYDVWRVLYSMIVGTKNITDRMPARHAFLMKLDCGGMKLASTPIEEPPRIEPPSTSTPSPFQYQIS